MKISRRNFLKSAATGIGSVTLAGLSAVEAGATQPGCPWHRRRRSYDRDNGL